MSTGGNKFWMDSPNLWCLIPSFVGQAQFLLAEPATPIVSIPLLLVVVVVAVAVAVAAAAVVLLLLLSLSLWLSLSLL